MIRRLSDQIYALSEDRRRHLYGTTLGVWIPPNSRLQDFNHVRRKAEELAVEVGEYKPFLEGQRGHDFEQGFPNPFPNIGIKTAPSGFSYCAFVDDFGPVSVRAALNQFEVVGFMPEAYSDTSFVAETARLVAKHDHYGVDALVVSFGANDKYGYSYPLEREAFRMVRERVSKGWRPMAAHIGVTYLHLAGSDELLEVPTNRA
ncbi:MAG: hypothetical protein K1X67_05155 [Fimbriimonadaceae bacterium]|nr:hypothetical protein [Fimbriimonadaceae bacterium]